MPLVLTRGNAYNQLVTIFSSFSQIKLISLGTPKIYSVQNASNMDRSKILSSSKNLTLNHTSKVLTYKLREFTDES